MSERVYEIIERVGGERPIDPAVPFSQLRVVILRTQHDLKRPRTAHEAHEVLGSAAAGDLTEGRLWLTENSCLSCRKAHVARQHEFAAGGPYAALDLRD